MMLQVKPKPPHGAPCNNCGACCIDELCPLGADLFGRTAGPCPALTLAEAGLVCGVSLHPLRYIPDVVFAHGAKAASEAAGVLCGVGFGCDCLMPGEPRDLEFSKRARQMANAPEVCAARKLFGYPERV